MSDGNKIREDYRRGPIPRTRIESLSDLIFGLALSIGAVTLIALPPTTPDEMNSRVIVFVFNFVILIASWLQYTNVMSRLPVETGIVVFGNVILLLLIILITYISNGIQYVRPPLPIPANTPLGAYSSQLYAIDLAGVVAILAAFNHVLGKEEKHLVPAEILGKVRRSRNLFAFFAVLFLISALPQFWDLRIAEAPVRFLSWWIPLAGTIYLDVQMFWNPKSSRAAR
ncbi:MAG: TMEM175 family protein [Thaumarchaeota archaeon]|nr:TMEM175 family protein [Nitrososphaerota archaeon]